MPIINDPDCVECIRREIEEEAKAEDQKFCSCSGDETGCEHAYWCDCSE